LKNSGDSSTFEKRDSLLLPLFITPDQQTITFLTRLFLRHLQKRLN